MRIGTLNRQVKLQRLVEAQDPETGAVTKTWQDVATVWANVRFLNGTETLKADTTISAAKSSIRIRWREDVRAKWRVLKSKMGVAIAAISQSNPAQVTAVAHGLATGEPVRFSGVKGMTSLNDVTIVVDVTGPDAYTLRGVDTSALPVYGGDGISHAQTIFNILVPLPDEQGREYVDLACDTGSNDG